MEGSESPNKELLSEESSPSEEDRSNVEDENLSTDEKKGTPAVETPHVERIGLNNDAENASTVAAKTPTPVNGSLPIEDIEQKGEADGSSPLDVKNNSDCQQPAINYLLSKLPELDKNFKIHGKIGEGTFSNVYLASLKKMTNAKKFAIKHLIPTCHPKRMKYELDCLNRIGGHDNVVSCELTMRSADCVIFIMPYLPHEKFSDYVLDMNVNEARLYMKNLLLALRRVHSFNIIHRDIKPSNFLYNRERKEFLLVDFGLAQKVSEFDDNPLVKPPFLKTTVSKRKREDDDSENSDKPAVKRTALQTLSNDALNKQAARVVPTLRYARQPLSIQQQKSHHLNNHGSLDTENVGAYGNMPKRQPFNNTSNVLYNSPVQSAYKPVFQSLTPQKAESGASFVRVQNSQVQSSSLFPRPTAPVRRKDACVCDGKPQICNKCLTRKSQYAPRAGTPGFRPPEVLLKYPNQTTAVDIWSAGVIMLCILSGCYPFFRSPDDITALSELITVFGSAAIVSLAKKLGRNVICNQARAPLCMWLLCETLRRRRTEGTKPPPGQAPCADCHHVPNPDRGCLCEAKSTLFPEDCTFPPEAFDLLSKLLDIDPDTRITAEKALQHPFVTACIVE